MPFSAIADSFNPVFERDSNRNWRAPQLYVMQPTKGNCCMKISKYLLVTLLLFFQASLCIAQDSINLYGAPDIITQCHQVGVEAALTKYSTIAVIPSYNCTNRNTYGPRNDQVTSTFNRVLFPLRYAPNGVFKNGYFIMGILGMEKNEFKSVAGSVANVSFIDTAILFGYQWFWRNGFNISGSLGVAHLIRNSLDQTISSTEINSVSAYLDQQTSTNTHLGGGMFLGWVF